MTTEDNTFHRVDWFGDQPQASDDDDEIGMPVQPPRGPGLPEADLELLTLAAYAFGAVRVESVDGENWLHLHFANETTAFHWNPLVHGDLRSQLLRSLLRSRKNRRKLKSSSTVPSAKCNARYGANIT